MPTDDYQTAPMVLTVFTKGFGEVDYSIPIEGAFGLTTPIQGLELEARAKKCALIIQVSMIDLDEFWGDLLEGQEGAENDEPTE